jgi:uncharacterized metal-binding protein
MSQAAAVAIAAMAYHNPGGAMPHRGLWLVSAAFCVAHELWATADRDLEPSRKCGLAHLYWLPYGYLVGHRSALSHGPVIGTAIRLAYGWGWLLWPLWQWADGGSGMAAGVLLAIVVGALVNDAAHLLLDL